MKPKRIGLLVVACLLVTASSFAGDSITTRKGTTYENIKVTRVDPDGITIRHPGGIVKLFFPELTKEDQDKYGYDPEKHRQHYNQQQRAAQHAATMRSVDSLGTHVEARLNQVQADGSLAYIKILTYYSYTERIKVDPTRDKSKSYLGSTPSIHSKDVLREGVRVSEEQAEPVFITGISSGYVDGQTWTGVVYPIGAYNYTTVMGASKKIKKYTTSKAEAARYYSQ